jgi:hypothetical protein
MTRRQLQRAVAIVIAVNLVAVFIGALLKAGASPLYDTFKDLAPFFFAVVVAYLGYCFQRRSSYLESLRLLWSQLVHAVQLAIKYTYDDTPTQEEYADVLAALGVAIDELRGVYKNIGEGPGQVGYYPYEPLKEIFSAASELGFGDLTEEMRETARRRINGHWKSIRANFLDEFDRAEPTKVVSPYTDK